MKLQKSIIALFLFIGFGLSTLTIDAQPALRLKSRRVLKRTTVALMVAKNHLRKHRNFTGDFSRAVAHQRYAFRLHKRGRYPRAIYHSRRARLLAFKVIKANKGTVGRDMQFDKDENAVSKGAPSDDDLDKELEKEMPNSSSDEEKLIDEDLGDIYFAPTKE